MLSAFHRRRLASGLYALYLIEPLRGLIFRPPLIVIGKGTGR
jgi:hypothetical protein